MIDTKDLTRLLKRCPNISLSSDDIQTVIDTGSFNTCISKYNKTFTNPDPANVYEVKKRVEVSDKELDEEEELADHFVECEDGSCECKSALDE
jgi:hypothetical protein